MIVTIDGPAGAGKSSVAKRLAERLGFQFLDTGAMYRAAAWAALHHGLSEQDSDRIAELVETLQIEPRGERILVNQVDVSDDIRTLEVAQSTHLTADNPRVRERMVQLQRAFAATRDTVTEGRDQGTVAFPHAECKIYLTASPEERARRRHEELRKKGHDVTIAEVLAQQIARDRRDRGRKVGPLAQAPDAIEFWTDGLTRDEVIDRLEAIVRDKPPGRPHG